MLGCTGGDKTASIALTSWGGGKEMMGGGQQGAGSLLSSIGGGRGGHYCGQHHGAGQEGQQHCGGPGAAEIAAMMNVVMGGGQHRAGSLSAFGGGQHHGAGHGCQQQCGGSLALIGSGQNKSAGGTTCWPRASRLGRRWTSHTGTGWRYPEQPGGPHRRLGNPATRWKGAWWRVESIPMEVDTARGKMDLEDRVGRVVSQMGLKKTRGAHGGQRPSGQLSCRC